MRMPLGTSPQPVFSKRWSRPQAARLARLSIAAGLVLFLLLAGLPAGVLAATLNMQNPQSSAAVLPDISPDIVAPAALVLESGRSRVLYELGKPQAIDLPIAAKLMTALIASEQLTPEVMITISADAAAIQDQAVDYGQPVLSTGEKYSFEYLLLRLLFYDSDAAALALAEQISGEESVFIEQMNARAQNLELADTKFASSTGLPAQNQQASSTLLDQAVGWSAFTTLKDLAKLFSVALTNSQLKATMQKSSEYQVLEGPTVVSLHHQLEPIWSLSDGRINGVLFSAQDPSTTLTFGQAGAINLITVLHGSGKSQAVNDTLALYDAIERHYEVATLVEAGEHFFGGQEKTLDGETFGLVYLKTVTYVRPIGQDFLQSAVQYQSFGPFSRPILNNMVIGQAIFQLLDGTTIAIDVGPDRQILSRVGLVDSTLKQLQTNPNLTAILLVSLGILALLLIYKVFFQFIRLSRIIRLLFVEIRSRR